MLQFTPSLAGVLFEQAKALPEGATLLEIGAYKGYTTCALALGCLGNGKHVWTIDTFIGNPENTDIQDSASYYDVFQKNIKAQGLSAYVTPLVGRSDKFYEGWSQPLDLLFIDGNHAQDIVQADLDAFFPWLKSGGYLFMHDVYPDPKPQSVNPTWHGIALKLTDCRYTLNLAWGRKA